MALYTKNFVMFQNIRKRVFDQSKWVGVRMSLSSFSVETQKGISCQSPQLCCCSTSTNSTSKSKRSTSKILYDGDCKICQIEISALKKLTRDKESVEFVNISSADYNAQLWGGVSYEDAMKEMHVVGPDGKVYRQASAVRHLYRVCGFGWLASLTELPVISPICDDLYVRFAKYRLRNALNRCDSNSCDIKLKHLKDKLEQEKEMT